MSDERLLSVIVPLAPHEAQGAELLAQLAALPSDSEIILALPDAREPPAWGGTGRAALLRCCRTAPGRARQMNAGARCARGRWLWFLHADSQLAPESLSRLRGFLLSPHPALGYFDLAFCNDGPRLTRLNAWGANVRARCLGLPFGDQGLVLPTEWFERLGGYDEAVACGEDHLLIWKAKAARLAQRPVGARLYTSARKYAQHGWFTTTRLHWRLTWVQARRAWRGTARGWRARIRP